jgi:hypothetical protein
VVVVALFLVGKTAESEIFGFVRIGGIGRIEG